MAKVKLVQLAQHGDLLERYGASIRFLGQREMLKPDVADAIDRAVNLTKDNGDAVLNVCAPYTSRDEITTAIRETVIEYTRPLPSLRRPFSESRITQNIRSRHLSSTNPKPVTHSPASGGASDAEDSVASSVTLHTDSPPDHTFTLDKSLDLQSQKTYPDPETITPETLDQHMFTAGMPPLDLLVRTSGVQRLSDFMLWQCHQDTEIVFLDCLWPEFDLWTFLPVLVEWQWRRRKISERDKVAYLSDRVDEILKLKVR